MLDEVNNPLEKELARAAFGSYGRKSNESAGQVINDVSVGQKADAYIFMSWSKLKIRALLNFSCRKFAHQFQVYFQTKRISHETGGSTQE